MTDDPPIDKEAIEAVVDETRTAFVDSAAAHDLNDLEVAAAIDTLGRVMVGAVEENLGGGEDA